jgi:hypothetical protein
MNQGHKKIANAFVWGRTVNVTAPHPLGVASAGEVTNRCRLWVMHNDDVVPGFEQFRALFVHHQIGIFRCFSQVIVTTLQGIMKSFSHGKELSLTVNETPFGVHAQALQKREIP